MEKEALVNQKDLEGKLRAEKEILESEKEAEEVNNAILTSAGRRINSDQQNDVIIDNLFTNFSHSNKNLNQNSVKKS